MSKGLLVTTEFIQISVGTVFAAGLVVATKRFNLKARLSMTVLVFLLAVLTYVSLALVSGNILFVAVELVGLVLFIFIIGLGYIYSFWFIALGWLLHVLWDIGLRPDETAPYIPQWYMWGCAGFDIVMALYTGFLIVGMQRKSV